LFTHLASPEFDAGEGSLVENREIFTLLGISREKDQRKGDGGVQEGSLDDWSHCVAGEA
jgi:hypothetical protein